MTDGEGGEAAPASVAERRPVTLITGPTSGIGLGLAHEFARTGHDLALVARSLDGLTRVEQEIRKAHGVAVHVLQADLTRPEACADIAATLAARGLHVEYLVNNAGFAIAGPVADNDPDQLIAMLDLNMRALTDLTRRFWPDMLARRAGGILNISSLAGFVPGPYQSAYYASKAYVISLTEAMAQEAWGSGVRMAVVAPGPVATEFHNQMGAQHSHYLNFLGMMDPRDVARISFSHFMCGQTVIIPGLSNLALAPFLRYIPHFVLVPFAAWLLKLRKGRG